MKNTLFLPLVAVVFIVSTSFTLNHFKIESDFEAFKNSLQLNNQSPLPSDKALRNAYHGFTQLHEEDPFSNPKLAIADFSLSSKKKRLWIINMLTHKIIIHSLVAHGKNSGLEYATQFSNQPQSYQSSLGFYKTGGTYQGKHGLSLYLDGLENDINSNARERLIVMHGADYVSEDFIKNYGRLGRSFGCPALPYEISGDVIESLKNGACLFIYHPNTTYKQKSNYVN